MSNQASSLSKQKIKEIFPQIAKRYTLAGKKPIGARSGFGTVWRAHDEWLDRDVALKISAEDLRDELILCRDIEGQTVRIFDYLQGEAGWNAYAMELLDQPWISLAGFIAGHKYKTDDAQHYFDCFEIARSLLNGLVQIHGRPYSRAGRFVHADIKPDNLFILLKPKKYHYSVFRMPAAGEMVKIIDMGISIENGNDLIGRTYSYGHPTNTDARQGVDHYSLAITFLEVLTGHCPKHATMENKARIRAWLANYSSGVCFLDSLAVDFANDCARSVGRVGIRSHRLLAQLEKSIFAIEPSYLLSLRAINKKLQTGLNKRDLAYVLFDVFAKNYGWSNRTDVRLEFIEQIIPEMYRQGMLLREGRSYFVR